MDDISIVGQVVGGKFGDIIVRQKAGVDLEIGDLLISEEKDSRLILQVFALEYGSQIKDRMQQMMSGVTLEQSVADARFYEPEFVNYTLAKIKSLARVSADGDTVSIPKSMPSFFSKLRLVSSEDLKFLQKDENQIFVGYIRSGTKVIREAKVWLRADDVFSHHVLIPATTGRGKSNLVKTVLWHVLDSNRVGSLVLDAHNEYFGLQEAGLKDHPNSKNNLVYYTPTTPPPGAHRLAINLQSILPEHFEGIMNFSDAQMQAIQTYHKRHSSNWIKILMTTDSETSKDQTAKVTMSVIQRKMRVILGLERDEAGELISRHKVFDSGTKGLGTADDIASHVEHGRVVVLDTSRLGNEAELIVGNIVASKLLGRYKKYKETGEIERKPIVSIVIEEAPRVIGEDVLTSKNSNIYATIAKEGRKFKIGLVAITQLSSVIPRSILANINTKIILGNEMKQERDAIISSASQDLSEDDRSIASLDKGEAIITSIFVPFAVPIKIPLFDDFIKKQRPAAKSGKTKVF